MRKYKVYITDRFTRIPLIKVEVIARTKFHAATIVKRELTNGDKSYIVSVRRNKKWAE